MTDHERIWLEPSPGADEDYGRQWCQHNVWGDEATEYVLATSVSGFPVELLGVAEELAEGSGAWLACSGCHELNEGHPTGPWSDVLKSHLGLGCRECGGIGAVWDNTDYSAVNSHASLTGRKPKAIDEERNVSELTDKLRELASRRHMDRGLDAVDDALREAASEIDRLREALATLTASASEFHEAVMPYLSDTTFDGDGVLANAEARLSVTALPLSRAALSPDNSTQKKEG